MIAGTIRKEWLNANREKVRAAKKRVKLVPPTIERAKKNEALIPAKVPASQANCEPLVVGSIVEVMNDKVRSQPILQVQRPNASAKQYPPSKRVRYNPASMLKKEAKENGFRLSLSFPAEEYTKLKNKIAQTAKLGYESAKFGSIISFTLEKL